MVGALLKGVPVQRAFAILASLNKKGSYHLEKVVKSAVANAKNKGFEEGKLYVSNVVVNGGPALKRYRAATFGRAVVIRKPTSHILVELDTPEKIIDDAKIK